MAVKQKNPAAVALGRRGGNKGGLVRAAKLTSEQRGEGARKAVQAQGGSDFIVKGTAIRTSDNALLSLLKRIKTTDNPAKIKRLSDQLERFIFRKQ